MSYGGRVALGRMASGFGNRFSTLFKGIGNRISGAFSAIKQFIKCPIPEACASPLSQNFGMPLVANQALEKQFRFGPIESKVFTPPRPRRPDPGPTTPKAKRALMFGGAGSFAQQV